MEALLVIHDVLNLLIAFLCFALAALLLLRVNQFERSTIIAFFFFIFMWISLTLEARPIHGLFDRWVGILGLAWLIGWSAKSLSIYCSIRAYSHLIKAPAWLEWGLGLTLVLSVIIFVLGIGNKSEETIHLVAQNTYEMAFMTVSHLWNALTCFLSAYLLFKKSREYPLFIRTRSLIGVTCSIAATSFFLTRLVLAGYGYIDPSLSVAIITFLFSLSLALAFLPGVICIPLSYLSINLFVKLMRPILWADEVILFRDLDNVRLGLSEFCPPLLSWAIEWRDILSRPILYTHQAMMDIWDRKKIIATYLILLASTSSDKEEKLEKFQTCYGLTYWDVVKRQRASRFLEYLEAIDDRDEFLKVIRAYQNLGVDLRKKRITY